MRMDKIRFRQNYKNNEEAIGTVIKEDNKKASQLRRKVAGKSISKIDGEYWSYLIELINTASDYTREEKNQTVEDIIEYYYQQTGYIIPNAMLTALADFILDEVLADKAVDKSKNTDYAILSWKQLNRRKKKQTPMLSDTIAYLDSKNTHNIAYKKNTSEPSENK